MFTDRSLGGGPAPAAVPGLRRRPSPKGRVGSSRRSVPPEVAAGAVDHRPAVRSVDLARGRTFLLLWGAPIALILATSLANGLDALAVRPAAVLWTIGTGWIAAGCLVNARRCGRVHCIIAGTLLLPLTAVAVAYDLRLLSFTWSFNGAFWAVFWGVIVLAFAVEFCGRPYYRAAPALLTLK